MFYFSDFSKKIEEASDSPASTVEPSPRVARYIQAQHQKKANQKKKNKRR